MIPMLFFAGALGTAIYIAVKGKKRIVTPDGTEPGKEGSTSGTGRPADMPTAPFEVTSVDGDVTITIPRARATYRWAVAKAAASGMDASSDAQDVLRMLAASATGSEIVPTTIVLRELDASSDWNTLLAAASGKTWGDVMRIASAWIRNEGLGLTAGVGLKAR